MALRKFDEGLYYEGELELEYRIRMNSLVGYIHEHLDEPLPLETLARVASFSPFHLHRIFTAFIGMPMGEYIRRLRLRRAVHSLATTRKPVTVIALEAGYDSPAAFSKAFRQAFSMSPIEARKLRKEYQPFKNFQTGTRRSVLMKPEIRTYPTRRIAMVTRKGMLNRNFNDAADRSFTRLCGYMDAHKLWKHVHECLGICPDDPDEVNLEEARYIGAFIIDDDTPIQPDGDLELGTIPGGRFAVFMHHGPFEALNDTWTAVYRDWLPASGVQLRDSDPFEVYLDDKTKTRPEDLRTEIYVPIK